MPTNRDASPMAESDHGEFSLSEVPLEKRTGFLSITMVLLSFTFFTGTMFAGGKIGVAFDVVSMIQIAVIGNLLLAAYAASLALIAARSGLNAVLMGRFCFGEAGSKLSDFLLGFAELGWYAWGTATVAIVLVKLLGWPPAVTTPLMILFGFGFSITAIIGYRGMDLLSRVSVPLMFVLLMTSMWIATRDIGGWAGLTHVVPSQPMPFSAAVTMVIGTFASGATHQLDPRTQCAQRRLGQHDRILRGQRPDDPRGRILRDRLSASRHRRGDDAAGPVDRGGRDAVPQSLDHPGADDVQRGGRRMPSAAHRTAPHARTRGRGDRHRARGRRDVRVADSVPGAARLDHSAGRRRDHGGLLVPPSRAIPSLAAARLPRFNLAGSAYAIGAGLAYTSPWIAPIVGIAASAAAYIVLLQIARAFTREPSVQGE